MEKELLIENNKLNLKCIVISGMAKTGTTLPLTLLDGHPELLVFPVELRFFHNDCHLEDSKLALSKLINDPNIQMLKKNKFSYDKKNYLDHGGTGFGNRDYSSFSFEVFYKHLEASFTESSSTAERFLSIIIGFCKAIGKEFSKDIIFVSKAPHNEIFIRNWLKMLNNNSLFIFCIRLPTEHFLSLRKVASISNLPSTDLFLYIEIFKYRLKLIKLVRTQNMHIIDYDQLTSNSKIEIQKICQFLNIDDHPNLQTPTKMGTKWAGNSSRGIIKESIFKNLHQAKTKLPKKDIEYLELGLHGIYLENNWEKIYPNTKETIHFTLKKILSLIIFKRKLMRNRLRLLIKSYKYTNYILNIRTKKSHIKN